MNLPHIDWIGNRRKFYAVSGALCALSLAAILAKGFNYGIDFTGGTVVQVTYEAPRTLTDVRADLDKAGYPQAQPQSFGGHGGSFAVYLKGSSAEDAAAVEAFLKSLRETAQAPFRVDRKEFVGPSVGRHLKRQAATAITLALLAIILYVAFRFDNPVWGAAGIAAIAHDVLITGGVFAALGLEVDLVIVAAFLTIAGYTINDTIVIFDRMRENLRIRRGEDLGVLINASINEMHTRTLITNGMVFIVVLALFVLGGRVIHNFALAMLVGAVVGTYSTVAISTPLIYEWSRGGRRAPSPPSRGDAKPAAKPRR